MPKLESFVLADINSYVPWPDFGPFESYEAEHTLEGGERLELAGFEIDVLFTPGHSPGHVTFSIPDEAAMFSGDVLFQGSVGRTDLPGRRLGHPARVDPPPGGLASRRRPPSTRATWAPPPWAPSARPTRSSPSWPGSMAAKLQAPRGTFDVLPADGSAPRRAGAHRRRAARPRRLRAVRDPGVRGHRGVRARGGGGHGHRAQGDVHLRGQGGPLADAAPRGHRRGLPRVRGARHAQAAAAGEAPLLGPVLPPRGAAGRPLPPVHPARRRGARLRRPLARRGDRAPARGARWRRVGRARPPGAPVEPRHAGDPRGVPGGAGRLPARARVRAVGGRARAARPATRCARSTRTTRVPAR